MPWGSLAVGDVVGPEKEPWNCASNAIEDISEEAEPAANYICVRGPVMQDGFTRGSSFAAVTQCKYINYTTADNSTTQTSETPSLCGFNQDTNYYCPVMTGDSQYQEFWQKYSGYLTTSDARMKCNPETAGLGNGENTPQCMALSNSIGDNTYWETYEQN